MYQTIKELFKLLTPEQRHRFIRLQILVVIMSFTTILGIASIAPFMALVGDISLLEKSNFIARVYQWSGIPDPSTFVFLAGINVLIFLAISTIISILTTRRLLMYANTVGAEIASRLYQYYLNQSWLFHAQGSSAQLIKQVSVESIRITNNILTPLMTLNAQAVMAIFLSFGIFILNPLVALIGISILVCAYLLIYRLVRKKLHKNGEAISQLSTKRFALLNEGLGGIKDVLLLGKSNTYTQRFKRTGDELAYAQGNTQVLGQVPRYFMELMAFGSMIALILYLLVAHNDNLGAILPILSVYALAGYKLMPALQQIYNSITTIKGNLAAFTNIKEDLKASQIQEVQSQESNEQKKMDLNSIIKLEGITFTYPNKSKPALNNLNLEIKANSVVGIVGPSGSGKSTLIDILLGLIEPDQGSLQIDNRVINQENLRSWQSSIGFVPQAIFLSEGTIAENVAFGVPSEQIDRERVMKALKLAHLDTLVAEMEKGIDTKVGERGVQLSGGQRQRIGIARALYNDADALVFDEATSALDGITEKMIMDAIHDFGGSKTIIMIAHRLKTVEKCDVIHLVVDGQLIDSGSYSQLLEKNYLFREMAKHT